MNEMKNKKAEGQFNPITLQIFNLFNNNHRDNNNHKQGYINNITGIAKDTGVSHVSARKHLSQMVAAGILEELFVGNKGKVFSLDEDSATTKAFIGFIDALNEERE